MDQIEKLAEWIKDSKKITVLSGAGISTESGIPDFRSATGVWSGQGVRQRVMSLRYFNNHREKFWGAYKDIFQIKLSKGLKPNFGHQFLANLEQGGKDIRIYTQNVDGLHQASGSRRVYEVHGSMRMAFCTSCGEEYDLDFIRANHVPRCKHDVEKNNVCNTYIPIANHPFNYVDCEGCNTRHEIRDVTKDGIRCKGIKKRVKPCRQILKPDVVLFGDGIRYYQEARLSAKESDLFIVLGSSLQVGPINEVPLAVSMWKTKTVIINQEETLLDNCFELVIRDSIGDVFRRVAEQMDVSV